MLKHALTISAATLVAAGALAQEATTEDPVAISSWNYEELYAMEGVRGENLLDAEVYGVNGEELADVEDVVLEGQEAVALVVETGGLWDIGDTHIVVPWDEVEFRGGQVVLPVTEENFENYDAWGDAEAAVVGRNVEGWQAADDGDVALTPEVYRLTDLLDDYVTTTDDAGYGYVDDVIISRDGSIEAVVTATRGGYYATPFYGPGWGYRPYGGTYGVGYGPGEVGELERFEYERVNDDWWS